MWLIIPKSDSKEDRCNWGFEDTKLLGFMALDDSAGAGPFLKHVKRSNDTDGWCQVASELESVRVLVLDSDNRQKANAPVIPEAIGNKVTRVFVHFGSWNLEDMSLPEIQTKWETCTKSLSLPVMPAATIMPMSEGGGVSWKEEIKNFRSLFTLKQRITLETLNNAWEIATQHFHKIQPLKRVVETLFPYFVDAHHFLNLPTDKGYQIDLVNAQRCARESIDAAKNKMLLEQVNQDELRLHEEAFDRLLPYLNETSIANLQGFITAYQGLSEGYTKLVLDPVKVEKANQRPASRLPS